MNWTKESPEEAGLYYLRNQRTNKIYLVAVTLKYYPDQTVGSELCLTNAEDIEKVTQEIVDSGEWCGPLNIEGVPE